MKAFFDNPIVFMIGVPLLYLAYQLALNALLPKKKKGRRRTAKKPSFLEIALLLVLLTIFLISNLSRKAEPNTPGLMIDVPYIDTVLLAFVVLGWLTLGFALLYKNRNRINQRELENDLDELIALSPKEFEQFVARLFIRRGYDARVIGESGDHGVDIEVFNPAGEKELVQCKRWTRKWLGEKVVREFYGALVHDQKAVRGYIVTTSFFSEAAKRWVRGKPISLIDGPYLAESLQIMRNIYNKEKK